MICSECGIEYKESSFAYKAHDDGKLLGCAQFDILSEYAKIDSMKQILGSDDDFEAMFILGRAVLNFLDLCGVENVIYDSKSEKETRLAKAIGFKEDNGILKANLTGMFDAKCEGHCDG